MVVFFRLRLKKSFISLAFFLDCVVMVLFVAFYCPLLKINYAFYYIVSLGCTQCSRCEAVINCDPLIWGLFDCCWAGMTFTVLYCDTASLFYIVVINHIVFVSVWLFCPRCFTLKHWILKMGYFLSQANIWRCAAEGDNSFTFLSRSIRKNIFLSLSKVKLSWRWWILKG